MVAVVVVGRCCVVVAGVSCVTGVCAAAPESSVGTLAAANCSLLSDPRLARAVPVVVVKVVRPVRRRFSVTASVPSVP